MESDNKRTFKLTDESGEESNINTPNTTIEPDLFGAALLFASSGVSSASLDDGFDGIDSDLTPFKSPIRLCVTAIEAIIPSQEDRKCVKIILKSGYAFDVWKHTATSIIQHMDNLHHHATSYIKMNLANHLTLPEKFS